MIRNWEEHNLRLDFSGMRFGKAQPSDVDMFFIGKHNTLVVGEIKNERGELKYGQRRLLEKLVDFWRFDAIALFIQHDKYVQYGDEVVDVSSCPVVEYYYHKQWHTPRTYLTAYDVVKKYAYHDTADYSRF